MSSSWYPLSILWLHLHPDFLQPQGLQIQKRPDQPEEALPLEEEGVKQGTGGPINEQVRKVVDARINTAGSR
jgi:hypothetical protein